MNGLQRYYHDLHVAKEPHVPPSSAGGSLREPGSFCENPSGGPPVLSSDDQDELQRLLEESKRIMLTEREILAVQKARKEATRGEACKRHDHYLNWLKEISAKQQQGKQRMQQMATTRRRSEEIDLAVQVRKQQLHNSQQLELSLQESQAACEFEKLEASAILQRSMAQLGAEKYDVQSFMDRQKSLREQQIAEFTDAYRESQRQGRPGERHRLVGLEALRFIRKAQALERLRQGERPDAATYHSLTTSPRKKSPRRVLAASSSIATPRLATQGRVILQPQRPLDPWQLR